MKKLIFTLFVLITSVFAQFEVEGYVAFDSQVFSNKQNKHSSSLTLEQQLEMEYSYENFNLNLKVYAQEDNSDSNNNDKKNNERSFVEIKELNSSVEFENSQFSFGKSIQFWGALEVKNIVDTFNLQETRNDIFQTDKRGAYSVEYDYYFDESELSLIVKLYEQDSKVASSSYIYSLLNGTEKFDENIHTEKSQYRPTVYLKYTGTLSEDYSLDYAFIVQNGYDSQRYLTKQNNTYTQNSYLVNKFMTYNTLVLDSTLYKLEAVYTDVLEDNTVSDYFHVALGVEHTLDALSNGSEIGLIGEYYYYETVNDKKLDDIDLSEVFQNDLFLGLRYSLNDEDDSSAVGGVILDMQYDEQSYYVEYTTRVLEMFKMKFDYRYVEPSKEESTAYSRMGRHQRVALNISYHF